MSATASWDAAGIDVALRCADPGFVDVQRSPQLSPLCRDGQLSRYLNLAPFGTQLTFPRRLEG